MWTHYKTLNTLYLLVPADTEAAFFFCEAAAAAAVLASIYNHRCILVFLILSITVNCTGKNDWRLY